MHQPLAIGHHPSSIHYRPSAIGSRPHRRYFTNHFVNPSKSLLIVVVPILCIIVLSVVHIQTTVVHIHHYAYPDQRSPYPISHILIVVSSSPSSYHRRRHIQLIIVPSSSHHHPIIVIPSSSFHQPPASNPPHSAISCSTRRSRALIVALALSSHAHPRSRSTVIRAVRAASQQPGIAPSHPRTILSLIPRTARELPFHPTNVPSYQPISSFHPTILPTDPTIPPPSVHAFVIDEEARVLGFRDGACAVCAS